MSIEYKAKITSDPDSDNSYLLAVTETHRFDLNKEAKPFKIVTEETRYSSPKALLDYIERQSSKTKTLINAIRMESRSGITIAIGGLFIGAANNSLGFAFVSLSIGAVLITRAFYMSNEPLNNALNRSGAIHKEKDTTYFKEVTINEGFRPKPEENWSHNSEPAVN